ncbi:MAG: hypothetical protein ACOYOA_15635 [Saprospiraceae bacterium]
MKERLKDTPTRVENKTLEELFLAIYFNDLEKVIEFKNQYPGIYAKKDKFIIDENLTFDLTRLTDFNRIIWFDMVWIEDIKTFVEKNKQRTAEMLDFWRSELGPQDIQRNFEYNHYFEYFCCEDPNDYENKQSVILDPISFFLDKGFREIDLQLYNNIECFEFAEVKKLLEQDAKVNICFYESESDSSAISRIWGEISFLVTCQVIPQFEVFEIKGYNQSFNITRMFGDILGLAAHIEMHNLLDKYYEDE